MKTEKQKMIAGELYLAGDPELRADRLRARKLVREFNESQDDQIEKRTSILKQLLGSTGNNLYMEPNIRFDYGYNTYVGENFFANFDCTILDVSEVRFGDNCMLRPSVHMCLATYHLPPSERYAGVEVAYPITSGINVWIGGHVTFNPGVTIGDNVVLAVGAVVVKHVKDNVVVGGNPSR